MARIRVLGFIVVTDHDAFLVQVCRQLIHGPNASLLSEELDLFLRAVDELDADPLFRRFHLRVERQQRRVQIIRLALIRPLLTRVIDHAREISATTYQLPEEEGVKLALILRAIQRIQRFERADRLLQNIGDLSQEESYFWYAKIFNDGRSGIKALRTLYG